MQSNSPEDFGKIAVAGAGTMGQGIAQLCAQAGYRTLLYDVNPEGIVHAASAIRRSLQSAVDKRRLRQEDCDLIYQRIEFSADPDALIGDLLVEAIVEAPHPKQALFREAERRNTPDMILASNTSSIPMEVLADGLERPERVVGLHFFNPATVMKLVEVIKGPRTLDSVVRKVSAFAARLGKTVVHAKDAPGFIVNRVARPYYAESLRLLAENQGDVPSIDAVMEARGFRMGPFRLMDLIGVDTNLSVTGSIYDGMGRPPRFAPHPVQQDKVQRGLHGRKSGAGFYSYP